VRGETGDQTDQESRSGRWFAVVILLTRHKPTARAIGLSISGSATLILGQPLATLSGGERQRLKLATHMAGQGGVYVLDEPTSGQRRYASCVVLVGRRR